ncbi:MAG: hypothetical protein ABEK04_06070 [Candidatus Nanohalobium sp.]
MKDLATIFRQTLSIILMLSSLSVALVWISMILGLGKYSGLKAFVPYTSLTMPLLALFLAVTSRWVSTDIRRTLKDFGEWVVELAVEAF